MNTKRLIIALLLSAWLLPVLSSCHPTTNDDASMTVEKTNEAGQTTQSQTEATKPNPLDNVAYILSGGFNDEVTVYFYENNDPTSTSFYGYGFSGSKYFLVKYKGKKTYLQATNIDLRDGKNEIEHLIIAFKKGQTISDLEKERLASCGIDYFFINSEIK